MDVLLNYWLTECELGRAIPKKVIISTINKLKLRNFFYYPALYTPYLYLKLLRQFPLNSEIIIHPLLDIIERWNKNNPKFLAHSSECPFSEVKKLIKTQRFHQFSILPSPMQ